MRREEQGYEPTIRCIHRQCHSECNNRLGACRSLRRPNHTVAAGSTACPPTNAGVGEASSELCPIDVPLLTEALDERAAIWMFGPGRVSLWMFRSGPKRPGMLRRVQHSRLDQ